MGQRPGMGYPGQQGMMGSAGQEYLLKGKYCSYSGSSGGTGTYSSSNWAYFDGQGRFQYGSSVYSSGDAGTVYGQGQPNTGSYVVQGNRIVLSYPNGGSDVAEVYNRSGNGSITEVMFAGKLYAPGLCE